MPMDGFSFSSRLASGNCLRRFHKCHLLPASGQVRAPRVPKRASYARFETTRGKETRVSARHAFPSATTTTVRDGRATLLLNFNVGSYGASRARGSSILFHRKTTAVPVDRGRVTRISPRSNLPPPPCPLSFSFFLLDSSFPFTAHFVFSDCCSVHLFDRALEIVQTRANAPNLSISRFERANLTDSRSDT